MELKVLTITGVKLWKHLNLITYISRILFLEMPQLHLSEFFHFFLYNEIMTHGNALLTWCHSHELAMFC